MDVFGAALEARAALCDAALAAGHELGVFEALGRVGPASLPELAAEIGVTGRRRLRALVDVLAAIGALACERATGARPRVFAAAAVSARPVIARAGWGLLAEVIRADRPLPATADDPAGGLRRFHHHLASAGAAAARELAGSLGTSSLLDLGAGAGTYSHAFLAAHPAARATLVDTREVLELAAAWLGPLAGRARLVEGDASTVDAGEGYGAALLANLLHLHPPAMCARLCAAAARAVAPGGVVVIKDLRVEADRTGPLEGLLFALNMAIYTDAGDVYPTSQLRAYLAGAGLVDIVERRLAAAPDGIVVIARRPYASTASRASAAIEDRAGVDPGAVLGNAPGEPPGAEGIVAELDAVLARTAGQAWRELVARGAIRGEAAAGPPVLAFPSGLRRFLAAAIALERAEAGAGAGPEVGAGAGPEVGAGAGPEVGPEVGPDAARRADHLVRHYADAMPRMHVAQLAGTDGPGQALFHTPLDWARLPRLGAAIDRLFAVLADAGVAAAGALGAGSADAFRARAPSLAALYRRTHYGGFMPLLYGSPADLAYMHARGLAEGQGVLATIDRYLTAPIVHELCHFAPDRTPISPPHLDECIAGWLGVHVHSELAYPAGEHDALYAAPWLAQVGQAVARAFGIGNLVRAHAGGELEALPRSFVAAAARLGWDDWRARRTLHFLSDTFDPAPWVALALAIGAGRSPAGETLASLAATPLATLVLPEDPTFDRAIVEDGLRAMCLATTQIAGSFRTRAELPDGPIAIDAVGCTVTAPRRGELDPMAPRYWLPPAVAARIAAHHYTGYELHLGSIAAIPDAAAAICEASPGVARAGFALAPRGA